MTEIAWTYPEPMGDILAQMAALIDPAHPKRAVWVSLGTQVPPVELDRVASPVGWLYAPPRLLRWFESDPTLEVLSEILDYVECKPDIPGDFAVVQAVTPSGWVVQEMAVGWNRLSEAWNRISAYGYPRVLSIADCLLRRRYLLAVQ